jgi:alkylation response protein AidB-like acyl-CoA dehydrogenase
MIADMHIQLEACRTLLEDAAEKTATMGAPRDTTSVAKVYIAEAAKKITDDCLQLHGGYGFSRQFPLEWYYRCARAASIAGGTVQIHRTMIASHVLGRKFDQRR